MRSLFLFLLLANLVFFALQFDVVRGLVQDSSTHAREPSVAAERMRIVKDVPSPPQATAPAG